MDNDFKIFMPAEIYKSDNGEYKIGGLASTNDLDQQGETIIQKGMDLTPVEEGKGFFNFDHSNKPEDLIGSIDGYSHSDKGLYVHGKLFKGHQRAEAIYAIMKGLSDRKKGAIGMSVEGKILERDAKNPKVIKKCQIKNVAITFNPVNKSTHAELVKSLNTSSLEFNTENPNTPEIKEEVPGMTFTAEQVVEIVQKALSIGGNAGTTPAGELSGGDALSMESMDKKPKKSEIEIKEDDDKEDSDKKLNKSNIYKLLDKIQELYPEVPRTTLWKAIKERLETKYDTN